MSLSGAELSEPVWSLHPVVVFQLLFGGRRPVGFDGIFTEAIETVLFRLLSLFPQQVTATSSLDHLEIDLASSEGL